MEWRASTLHTTSEYGVSSITTADAHTSAVSSRLNWRPRRFKWTRPFRWKTKSGFCAYAITFQTQFTSALPGNYFICLLIFSRRQDVTREPRVERACSILYMTLIFPTTTHTQNKCVSLMSKRTVSFSVNVKTLLSPIIGWMLGNRFSLGNTDAPVTKPRSAKQLVFADRVTHLPNDRAILLEEQTAMTLGTFNCLLISNRCSEKVIKTWRLMVCHDKHFTVQCRPLRNVTNYKIYFAFNRMSELIHTNSV